MEDNQMLAQCLEMMSSLPDLGPDKIVHLLGAAESVRKKEALAIHPLERPLRDELMKKALTQLNKEELNISLTEGQTMTYKQAVTYARGCFDHISLDCPCNVTLLKGP